MAGYVLQLRANATGAIIDSQAVKRAIIDSQARMNATETAGIAKGLIYGPAEFDECVSTMRLHLSRKE